MILGHQKQWEILKKSAGAGKLAHAYLFSGDEKLGKKRVAFEFISRLFEKDADFIEHPRCRFHRASPTLSGQSRDIEKAVHPDFIFLEPVNKEIQISQIRDLSWKLSLKNFSAPLKAAIIDKAHLMNFEAQSCLLKTLEEPRGKAILILVTSHPRVLLPTIISRCQTIKFYPVSDSEIENYLISKGMGKERAEEITQISLGRPGLALDFLSEPQKIEKYRKVISDLVKIFNKDISFRFQYVKNISRNAKSPPLAEPRLTGEILEIWLWHLRKVLLSKINGREELAFKNFSLAKLKNFIEELQRTIFLTTSTNINQRLALENLMLEL